MNNADRYWGRRDRSVWSLISYWKVLTKVDPALQSGTRLTQQMNYLPTPQWGPNTHKGDPAPTEIDPGPTNTDRVPTKADTVGANTDPASTDI